MSWQQWQGHDPYDEYDGSREEFVGDQIMCLVDCRAPMVSHHFAEGQGSHLASCLKLIVGIMKFKIVHGDNSSIGVLFFGTKKIPENPLRRNNYVEFVKLSVPSAENIHKLQEFVDKIHIRFEEEVGSQDSDSKSSHINEVLWKCNDEFQRCAPKGKKDREYQTRIWIFTNNDSPEDGDLAEQNRIVETAKRFHREKVPISLWYIDTNYIQQSFKVGKFFEKMLITDTEDESEYISSRVVRASLCGFDAASNKVREHFYQKRQLYYGLMDIGVGEVKHLVGVQLFSQYKIAKKPTSQKIDAETHEILAPDSSMITHAGKVLTEGEMQESLKQYVSIGDSLIAFTRAHIDELVEAESRAPVRRSVIASYSSSSSSAGAGAGAGAGGALGASPQAKPSVSLLDDDDDDDVAVAMADDEAKAMGPPPVSAPASAPADDIFEAAGRANSEATLSSAQPVKEEGGKKGSGKKKEQEPFVSVHVLYYTSPSKIKPELSLCEPLFVVPHDMSVGGSSFVFAALLDTMLRKDLVAIVKYCGPDRVRKYPPRLGALLPQKATTDASGQPIDAAGFNLLKLPFKGDLRANPTPVLPNLLSGLNATHTAAAGGGDGEESGPGMSAVAAAEQMIQSLMIDTSGNRGREGEGESQESSQFTEESQDSEGGGDGAGTGIGTGTGGPPQSQSSKAGAGRYDYLNVVGPALQHFYSVLEGIALKYRAADRHSWKPTDDRMVPDLRQFSRPQQRKSVEAFKAAVQLPDNAVTLVEEKKRKSVYESGSGAEKKPKVEMAPETLASLKACDLADFTVPALKNHLRGLGLPVGGKKDELIERIKIKIATM